MTTILPVVNCLSEGEIEERILLLSRLQSIQQLPLVHLDVADGRFTFHKTWNESQKVAKILKAFPLEVHLMVERPEEAVEEWLLVGAKRIIVQYESIFLPDRSFEVSRNIFDKISLICGSYGVELMVSIAPETSLEEVLKHLGTQKLWQILAVYPGLAGQGFLSSSYEKISFLRQQIPDATIEVDGGVKPEIVRRALSLGANLFTSDSYIFRSTNPELAYQELINTK